MTKLKGITIRRMKKVLDKDGKEVMRNEYLICRVNSAVPNNHRMISLERF